MSPGRRTSSRDQDASRARPSSERGGDRIVEHRRPRISRTQPRPTRLATTYLGGTFAPFCEFGSLVIRPEVHEKEPGLLFKHMAVDGDDLDPIFPQGANHWVQLPGGHDEVASDCCLAVNSRLKIDRCAGPHGCGGGHSILSNRLFSRNGELVHAAIYLSLGSKRLI